MPGKCPSLVSESEWQRPHACTLTRTSRGPGCGISRSTISKGPPGRLTWTTRILGILTRPSYHHRRRCQRLSRTSSLGTPGESQSERCSYVRSLRQVGAAVDENRLTVHVGGVVREQERHHGRDVL